MSPPGRGSDALHKTKALHMETLGKKPAPEIITDKQGCLQPAPGHLWWGDLKVYCSWPGNCHPCCRDRRGGGVLLGLMQFASAPRGELVAEEWHTTQSTATAPRGLAD